MGAFIEIVWLEGRQPQVHTAPYARVLSYFAMGKHLTADELDSVQAWRSQGISTLEIHRRLQHARATGGGDGPNLSTVRRALRGVTHRRGMVETRGRKRTLSPANIRALNTARKRLIAKADGQYDVHWSDITVWAIPRSVKGSAHLKRLTGGAPRGVSMRWAHDRVGPSGSSPVALMLPGMGLVGENLEASAWPIVWVRGTPLRARCGASALRVALLAPARFVVTPTAWLESLRFRVVT